MKKSASLFKIIRLLIGLGLLAIVIKQLDFAKIKDVSSLALQHPQYLIIATLMTFLGLFSGVIRWWRILKGMGFDFSFTYVFNLTFISQFFNTFMPGACGGDIVKAYYVSKECKEGLRVQAATTVFADRLIGLFSLIFFCCGMIALRLGYFLSSKETKLMGLLMLFFFAGSILGFIVFFKLNVFEKWSLFRKIETKFKFGVLIRRAYEALYAFSKSPGLLFNSIIYSLLNMVFLTLAIVFFGKALDIPVSTIDYFTVFPIITVLSAVPISPGGLGLREGLFLSLFSTFGIAYESSFALSFLGYLAGVFWGVFGWILYIQHSSNSDISLREELKKL